MVLGIDISVHNGIVNVQKVKEAGYGRVFIRAGYGKNNIDQKFITNAESCCTASMPTGIYWFSYGYSEAMAKAEGEYALAAARKYWAKCPIAFDLEYDTVAYARKNGVEITKTLATKMAIAFLQVIVEAGYIPVLYTNKDYKDNYFDVNLIQQAFKEKIYIWYARYTKSLNSTEQGFADMWQKSSTGKIDGISGNVDINEVYTDFDDIVKPPAPPTPAGKNLNVLYFQQAANMAGLRDANGAALAEDGIEGPKTKYVRGKVLLKATQTANGYTTGSTGSLVTWWQSRLVEMGYSLKVDGYFGAASRKNTLAFQKAYQLSQDGIVGYNSATKMIFH